MSHFDLYFCPENLSVFLFVLTPLFQKFFICQNILLIFFIGVAFERIHMKGREDSS